MDTRPAFLQGRITFLRVSEQVIQLDSNWFSAERDVKRSKGLHLSHVLNFIEASEGKNLRDDNDKKSLHNYACGGFLWERVVEHMIEDSPETLWEWIFTSALRDVPNPNVVRPGEQFIDGIYMTPDGYNIADEYLEEWKYTSKSSNNPITSSKFRRWVSYQIPAYLYALRLHTCRLRVYFSRGDYKSPEPQWREYIISYTQQEIEEIWEVIRMNAQYMHENGLVNRDAV